MSVILFFSLVVLGVFMFSVVSESLDDPRKEEETAVLWEPQKPQVHYGNGKTSSYDNLHSYVRQYEMGFLSTKEYLEKTAKTVRELQNLDNDGLSKCIAR